MAHAISQIGEAVNTIFCYAPIFSSWRKYLKKIVDCINKLWRHQYFYTCASSLPISWKSVWASPNLIRSFQLEILNNNSLLHLFRKLDISIILKKNSYKYVNDLAFYLMTRDEWKVLSSSIKTNFATFGKASSIDRDPKTCRTKSFR